MGWNYNQETSMEMMIIIIIIINNPDKRDDYNICSIKSNFFNVLNTILLDYFYKVDMILNSLIAYNMPNETKIF